jgi:hypothetical protein
MYLPKYFSLNECFPPDFPKSWKYFDERILISADKLRETFGALWCNGNGLTQCGFRTNGSVTSQHRFGRALDLHSNKYSSEEMRKYIIRNREMFPYIKFLELSVSWLHIDCRNSAFQLWCKKRGFISEDIYLTTGDI